uniref:Uncharacterized protein n=1 Tax=Arundo donax TaxID=35708 RepID=A0A0A9FMC5_ARUDO
MHVFVITEIKNNKASTYRFHYITNFSILQFSTISS